MGNAPAHVLFERVQATLKDGVTTPRSFADYDVQVDSDHLQNGVSILEV
jgi:CRISPR-associated protein Csd2